MTFHIDVDTGPEWNRVIKELGKTAATLQGDLDKVVTKRAGKARDAAKASVLAMPVKGPKSTGLRKRVARGTQSRKGRAEGQRKIQATASAQSAFAPRGIQNAMGWRHPVFGGPVWVRQIHNHDWFYGPIRESVDPELRNELQAAVQQAINEVRDAGRGR